MSDVLIDLDVPWPGPVFGPCQHGQRHRWARPPGCPQVCMTCGRLDGIDDVKVDVDVAGWPQMLAGALAAAGHIRSGLAPVSKARAAQAAAFAPVAAAAFARDSYECQFWRWVREATACGDLGPTEHVKANVMCDRPLHPHHRWPQGRGGPDDVDNVTTLCGYHHDWTHQHHELAYSIGLLIPTTAPEPEETEDR